MQTFRMLAVFGMVLAALASTAVADQIPWLTDWRQARDLAQQQHRLVLLHFWSESCAPCKRLEQHVFIKPEVARAISAGYIPVKINVDQDPQLAQHYRVTSWPTDLIVDPTGKEVHRQISPQDANQYVALLDSVKAHHGVHLAAAPAGQAAIGTSGVSLSGQPSPPRNNPRDTAFMQAHQSPSRYTMGGNEGNRYSGGAGLPDGQTELAASGLTGAEPQTAAVGQPYANPYAMQSPSQPPAANLYGSETTQNTYAVPQQHTAAQQHPSEPVHRWGSQPAGPQTQHAAGQAQQATAQAPAQAPVSPQTPSGQPSISLDGYCPVTLVEKNTWLKGDTRWGAVHRGRTYIFSSYVSQQRFLANPDYYSPVLSGYDPVRFFDSNNVVEGRREHGLYYGEQYFLFSSEETLEHFRSNPQPYVAQTHAAMQR